MEGQTRYCTVLDRHTIKLDKNKMNLMFTKSHQCSLERSHTVLTEINPEFWSRSSPFLTKTDSNRFTSHKNLQKQNSEDFFIQLLYDARLHLTNNNIRPPYLNKFLSNPYLFKSTHQTGLQRSSHPGIFQTILPLFGAFLKISTTRFNFLFDILQETIFCYGQP